MEGKRAPTAAAATISAVLDDDDLLCEILLRVAFPTSLVRAAVVCRRWLRLASAPAFLRRFRDLHPPSLLGFYVVAAGTDPPRFVPLPQPPELAAVVSRASFDLDNLGSDNFDVDCCNGLLLLTTIHMYPERPAHTTRVRLMWIYNVAFVNNIRQLILLDLVSSSLSVVSFPEEMNPFSYELSLTDDYSLHLIHVKGSQLHIWLHKLDDNGISNWFLEDTICLREIWANCMMPTCMFKDVSDSFVKVHVAGANSEFVFLEMDAVLYLFDIKRKVATKVYEVTPEDKTLACVIPFMMVWPPKFPGMTERCDPKE